MGLKDGFTNYDKKKQREMGKSLRRGEVDSKKINETMEVITNAGCSPPELKKIILDVYNKLPDKLQEEIYNYFFNNLT